MTTQAQTEQTGTTVPVTQEQIQQYLQSMYSDGALSSQDMLAISEAAIKNNVSPAQLAEAATVVFNKPISETDVTKAFQETWATDNNPTTTGQTNLLTPANTTTTGALPTQSNTPDIPRQLSPDEWATQQGYTRAEDGRYRAPDGESYVDADQIQGMMPDYGRTLKDAGFIPVGAGGLTQETVGWLNNKYGTNFADPADYYRYLYGGGTVVNDPETGMSLFRMPEGANPDRPVNQPLSYTPAPTWADYAFPAAFGMLLGAGVTGMLPGTTSLFGGAGALSGGGGALTTGAASGGGLSAADVLGLQQMGQAAGLSGPALEAFVNAGGMSSLSSLSGLSGFPTGLLNTAGNGSLSAADQVGLRQMGQAAGLQGEALEAFVNAGGAASLSSFSGLPGFPTGLLSNAANAATTAGATTAGATKTAADATKAGGLTTAITKLFDGKADAKDLLTLGLTTAGAAALLSDNPDRTTTSKVEYPDWYNKGSQSALALADKFSTLGTNSVAPLSSNEVAANTMASTYAGKWLPTLEKANSTIDSAQTSFGKAGALADSVPGYLNRAAGQVDAAMPYFGKADSMADTVSGYLNKSGALADQAAGGIPSIDLSAYMNPYLDNVLEPIARRNELAKAAALNDIKAKAGMRGAFGGSRSTLLETETAGNADRNLNEAEANIRSGAFTTGLNTAQADLNRKLQASGQYGALGTVAGNTANTFSNIGKSVADTAGQFNNMGVVATGAANANTNIGKSLTDAASGYRANAGTYGALTSTDIGNLQSTGATTRGVEQAKLNAPLTAIGGYANALRGNPGATTTSIAPEASKIGQATGALTALLGANKAGWI